MLEVNKKLEAKRYIPSVLEYNRVVESEKPLYCIYVSDKNLMTMAFTGKKGKHTSYYSHTDKEKMEKFISNAVESNKRHQADKDEWKTKRKKETQAELANVKIGDIYHASWGYEQTNNNFWQVTDIKKSMLTLKPIGSTIVEDSESSWGSNIVTPIKDGFLAGKRYEPVRKRLTGNSIRFESYMYAYKIKEDETFHNSWGY